MKVVNTTSGIAHPRCYDGKELRSLSEQEAEALAREANAKAEKLGIVTRYEARQDATDQQEPRR